MGYISKKYPSRPKVKIKNNGWVLVLFKIINSLNLSYSEAKKVISERIYKNDIDKQWETSYKVHVSGVPTYYIDKKVLVGAQTEENLITLVKSSKKN